MTTAEQLKQDALPQRCLYVYGIVDRLPQGVGSGESGDGWELTGTGRVAVAHRWLDPAELDDLNADVAEGSRLADLARRHDSVVRALASRGAVLPVRLGTLLPDRASVLRLLHDREQRLAAELDRIRDRGEWDVRIKATQQNADQPAEHAHAGGPGGSGTAYLVGRRDAHRRRTELQESLLGRMTEVHDALSALADAVAGPGAIPETTSVSAAYLVDGRNEAVFTATAEEAVAELEGLGCVSLIRGPLPAYSFVDVRLETPGHV
jgi:hypothetical protein